MVNTTSDWLATGGVLPFNPVSAGCDSLDVSTPISLRDGALIFLVVYSFAASAPP